MIKVSEIFESVKLAIESLTTNKMRSFLASFGVVIGISIVIMIGWAIRGLDLAMNETFNTIGVDIFYIDKWDWAGGGNWKELRNRKNLTYKQYKELSEGLKGAELIFPSARKWSSTITYENEKYTGISVIGTTNSQSKTPGGDIAEGRFFSKFEEDANSNVVVIGHNVYKTLFPNGNALGAEIKVSGVKFKVVGVVKKQGAIFFDFLDNQVLIPINKFFTLYGNANRSISIGVKAGSVEKLDEVRMETTGLMRGIRNLSPSDKLDFSINETKTFESSIAEIRKWVYIVGLGMTTLSFIVGIIGIMNIMFVSVTERTKEIGIRKAIGAKKSSIWIQFVTESSILCFAGALISLAFCSILVWLIATIAPQFQPGLGFLKPYLPYELLIIASFVSIFVGILAGLIPAVKAANLDPVESLRFE